MNQPIKLESGEVARIDQPKDWEQRFDKEFCTDDDKERPGYYINDSVRGPDIKDFIRHLLKEQRLVDSIEPDEV